MTGTITYILSRAGYRAMNGPLADERRRLAGAEPPAAYVSYDPRLLAGAGWYGYRIALNGGDRSMVERARYMLSERYVIRDGYEYYADGVYVFGVLLRERVKLYGIGGGAEPTPEPDALNFYMPNGGTISLIKTGSPTVVELEYSLDRGATWTVWPEDQDGNRSLVLNAGQRMYVRNTSNTPIALYKDDSNRYNFRFNSDTYANGKFESIICKNVNYIGIVDGAFRRLFNGQSNLCSIPEIRSNIKGSYAYHITFSNTHIEEVYIDCPVPYGSMFYYAFSRCSKLKKVVTNMTDISATECLFNWLNNVAATGDFYCPAELTIPTGPSGIPTGWTRHDI